MIYAFDDYALDTRLYELRRGGEPCPLAPQVFNVLAYLIAHRDRVVTKNELIAHLWPAQFVSDATLHQHVTVARKATGDSGRHQRIIKTLRSRGDRFIAPSRSTTTRLWVVVGQWHLWRQITPRARLYHSQRKHSPPSAGASWRNASW